MTFYTQAIAGQAEIMAKRRPLEKLIADPATPPVLKQRFQLSREVLAFARHELAMPSNGSYESYTDLKREHVVWVVHGAPELSLEPKRWWYPVVGPQDYRGFFHKPMADREAAALRKQGFADTYSVEVDAYSTLGVFRDPLINTFIARDEMDFVEVLFHELVHHQYYAPGQTKMNEGLAEAVAREGMRRWYRSRREFDKLAIYELRLRRLAQAKRAIGITVERLRHIYQNAHDDAWKRRAKAREIANLKARLRILRGSWGGGLDAWIHQPVNNARLNSFIAYEDEVPRFTRMIKECDDDFSLFWQRIKHDKPH